MGDSKLGYRYHSHIFSIVYIGRGVVLYTEPPRISSCRALKVDFSDTTIGSFSTDAGIAFYIF